MIGNLSVGGKRSASMKVPPKRKGNIRTGYQNSSMSELPQ